MEESPSLSKHLLEKALTCLSQRDISASRKYAAQALESDPNIAAAKKVLAVTGVLLAGDRRLRNGHLDFYSIIQLSRADSKDCRVVWSHFEKLATLVNPSGENDDVAFAAEAYDLLFEAWSVLSDAERKSRYDAEIRGCGEEDGGTFWTVCPYCYCMFEYGKVYEECCLRCQKCERAFHGVAIKEPSPEIVVPGKDQYYFCYGVFPLGYKEGNFNVNVNVKDKKEAVVEISDDDSSDGEKKIKKKKKKKSTSFSSIDFGSSVSEQDDLDGFWEEMLKNGNNESQIIQEELKVDDERWGKKKCMKARARRMKNVKSVASKKAKLRGGESEESGDGSDEDGNGNGDSNGGGCGGGELVFFEGEKDLFVGLVGTP